MLSPVNCEDSEADDKKEKQVQKAEKQTPVKCEDSETDDKKEATQIPTAEHATTVQHHTHSNSNPSDGDVVNFSKSDAFWMPAIKCFLEARANYHSTDTTNQNSTAQYYAVLRKGSRVAGEGGALGMWMDDGLSLAGQKPCRTQFLFCVV